MAPPNRHSHAAAADGGLSRKGRASAPPPRPRTPAEQAHLGTELPPSSTWSPHSLSSWCVYGSAHLARASAGGHGGLEGHGRGAEESEGGQEAHLHGTANRPADKHAQRAHNRPCKHPVVLLGVYKALNRTCRLRVASNLEKPEGGRNRSLSKREAVGADSAKRVGRSSMIELHPIIRVCEGTGRREGSVSEEEAGCERQGFRIQGYRRSMDRVCFLDPALPYGNGPFYDSFSRSRHLIGGQRIWQWPQRPLRVLQGDPTAATTFSAEG